MSQCQAEFGLLPFFRRKKKKTTKQSKNEKKNVETKAVISKSNIISLLLLFSQGRALQQGLKLNPLSPLPPAN